MLNQQPTILFINMAKGFGGGEYQSEQLMTNLTGYNVCFFGKSKGKFAQYLQQHYPKINVLNCLQLLKLIFSRNQLIIHALDGRGAHIAGILKKISGKPLVITRHVNFQFKRKSSLSSYQQADMLVGVSKQVTDNLKSINPNHTTIYGCIKPLQENNIFEKQYFEQKNAGLSVVHIGNLQAVKNFPLTIELAGLFPQIQFYIVGSGELENELKAQAADLSNLTFIPFTQYIGSIFKHCDIQILPSHSEGLPGVILEGYQYWIPIIAHHTGGIPEIVKDGETGFLIKDNGLSSYQKLLQELLNNPNRLIELRNNISAYMTEQDFSAQRMAKEYQNIYQTLLSPL